MAKERSEVLREDQWQVEAMYPSLEAWQKDFDLTCHEGSKPRWPKIAALQGKLGTSPEALKSAIELILSIERKLTFLYTYAHLRNDENISDDATKSAFKRISAAFQDYRQETSWFEPELLSLSEEQLKSMMASPVLAPYRFHIEKIVRIKPHVLPQAQEQLMAMAGQVLQASHRTFSAINDADFDFGMVLDSEGKTRELTHASYGLYMRNRDRTLRKNAFLQMHRVYEKYENSLCEMLNGQVQGHLFNARARGFKSCLEASLFPRNIDLNVYHALIKAAHKGVGALHQYAELRQRLLGLDELRLYDMSVPLTAQLDIKMPYKEAEDLIIDSVSPLGKEYQDILRKGFKDQRWVDRYENKNKRSGAYSSGCYDSQPYILMNYKDLLRDVFTLAHEAGHSMHSYLSNHHQPYHYSDYPIFLAEVASTFNEELLMRRMLERMTGKEEKIYLLTQKIEDIRGTLFRQVMFAEFELAIHTMAEQNIPLTPKLLRQEMRKLIALYFGPTLVIDKEADAEWGRIPHFYYNFYVYQYATGISAALALAERVLKGGKVEQEAYLTLLKGGSSKYPLDLLKDAGVDMRSSQPVETAISTFASLVKQLDKLTTGENLAVAGSKC